MYNIQNFQERKSEIDFSKMPDIIRDHHEDISEMLPYASKDATIDKCLSLYFDYLNKHIPTNDKKDEDTSLADALALQMQLAEAELELDFI